MNTLREEGQISIAETRETLREATNASSRIEMLDWQQIARELNDQGSATLKGVLTPHECGALAGLYQNESGFRSRVVMGSHGFGRGEYKYFSYPLPGIVQGLRTALYRELAPVANQWNQAMGIEVRYPREHADFVQRCHDAGQTRPTPLLLQYDVGDYNCLHQDLYGEHVFPIQVAFLLSEPGRDFTGGEFVLTEQRPRMQSRPEVVQLPRRCRKLRGSSSTCTRKARNLSRQSAAWCKPPSFGATTYARHYLSRREIGAVMAARLFEDLPEPRLLREALGPGTAILNGFAHGVEAELVSALKAVVERAPLRHMVTPGGFRMSVAMTNCGRLGWVTDRTGYRYDEIEPETGLQWPAMPPVFARLAAGAAREAGYSLFLPDACLINRYEPGARLSLHQDKK